MPIDRCKFGDRVRQSSVSEGVGNFQVTGTLTCSQRWSEIFVVNDECYYLITSCMECCDFEEDGQWEVGKGIWRAGDVLQRVSVLSSSNGGSKVNFASGIKLVMNITPAQLYQDLCDEIDSLDSRVSILEAVTPFDPAPFLATGPFTSGTQDGGWDFGGWSPVYTANTAWIDTGYENFGGAITAPNKTTDMVVNIEYGVGIHYGRECRMYTDLYHRVLVNGAALLTRRGAYVISDHRTNLGNETNLSYQQSSRSSHNERLVNVPAGAVIQLQVRARRLVQSTQTNAWARFITGGYSSAGMTFTPRRLLAM